MSVLVLAGLAFGAVAMVAGRFVLLASTARRAGWLLSGLGGVSLCSAAAFAADASWLAEPLRDAAMLVVLPLTVALYPRARLTSIATLAGIATIVAFGGAAVARPSLAQVSGWVVVGVVLLLVWWHFEVGDPQDRRSLAWSTVAWGFCGLVYGAFAFSLESAGISGNQNGTASLVAGLLLSAVALVAMTVGVARPDLVDVRGVVTQLVVTATVATTFMAVVIGVTSVMEIIAGHPMGGSVPVLVAAGVAFGVHRLSSVLRGIVDRLLFGDRPQPLSAAMAVAARVGDDPALALAAVREALVLPYASLVVDGTAVATSGAVVSHTRTLPLAPGAALVVGLRPGDLSLKADDEAVLRIVAPLLAQTLRAQALADDLAVSRGAAIAAIEEERRRLRRELHDGVGPSLTGVAFAADAAGNLLASDPARSRELLVKLRADTADAIAEIRRVVDDLRPAALDELGLSAAIRQYAAGLHAAGGRRLTVAVTPGDPAADLPAAVEVAAYRITVEALTNVARHSTATSVDVVLAVGSGTLRLLITDDGDVTGQWRAGAGIGSMRERAEQVGGRLRAGPGERGGVVEATLPL